MVEAKIKYKNINNYFLGVPFSPLFSGIVCATKFFVLIFTGIIVSTPFGPYL
jgi:hypothetical protein